MKHIIVLIVSLISLNAFADLGVASGNYSAKKWDNNLLKESEALHISINAKGTVVLSSNGFSDLNSLKGRSLEVITKQPGVYALKEFPYMFLITRESGNFPADCTSELMVFVGGAEGASVSCTEKQ